MVILSITSFFSNLLNCNVALFLFIVLNSFNSHFFILPFDVNIKSVKASDKVMVYTQFSENEYTVKDIPELTRQHPCKKMVVLKNKDVVLELVVE